MKPTEERMTLNRAEFSGSRLRLARSFGGHTQAALGELVGVTHQFIGYLEAGKKTPTDLLVEAISDVCGFEPEFFFGAPIEEFRDEECHFRRRASTPVSLRARVLAHGSLFGMLVGYIDSVLKLPVDDVPTVRVSHNTVRSRSRMRAPGDARGTRGGGFRHGT
jgi:transcriptional regulator with XRE-family HTH domain